MSSTNHDLARAAAENERLARQAMAMIQAADLSIAGGIKIIADTYAAQMAELERLKRQVAFVKRKHPKKLKSGPLMLDRCQCCDGWNGNCEPDCPNNEVAT